MGTFGPDNWREQMLSRMKDAHLYEFRYRCRHCKKRLRIRGHRCAARDRMVSRPDRNLQKVFFRIINQKEDP